MKYLPLACLLVLPTLPALGSESWDSIRDELFGDRPLRDGSAMIALDVPYRTYDDARTEIAAQIVASKGLAIDKVTLVLDENPMPVSAVFDLQTPQSAFYFDTTMRVNGPTPLHIVAETDDGELWMVESFVKTSGQGACAAAPGTDPEEALATLGKMKLEIGSLLPQSVEQLANLDTPHRKLDVDISHPSHSGMQMDQITLLYIPMRYVDKVQIDLDGSSYVDVTGSISLSENPRLGVAVPSNAQTVDVLMTDTEGTVSHAQERLVGY